MKREVIQITFDIITREIVDGMSYLPGYYYTTKCQVYCNKILIASSILWSGIYADKLSSFP